MRIAFSEVCKRVAAAKPSQPKAAAFPDASAAASDVRRAWEELGAIIGRIDTSRAMTDLELAGFKRLLALKGELLKVLLAKYEAGDVE